MLPRHTYPILCSATLIAAYACEIHAAPLAPVALRATSEVGRVVLGWDAQSGLDYRVLRCEGARRDAGKLACDVPAEARCTELERTRELHYADQPPRGKVFCYHVKACGRGTAEGCSTYSAGAAGAQRPPRSVAVSVVSPREVAPGSTVTMQAAAASAGKVTEFRWAQSGAKDILAAPLSGATFHWKAPDVAEPKAYHFKVMAEDDYGTRDIKVVTVAVVPKGVKWVEPKQAGRAPTLLEKLTRPN